MSHPETVTVQHDSLGFVVINKGDFDPEIHKLYNAQQAAIDFAAALANAAQADADAKSDAADVADAVDIPDAPKPVAPTPKRRANKLARVDE